MTNSSTENLFNIEKVTCAFKLSCLLNLFPNQTKNKWTRKPEETRKTLIKPALFHFRVETLTTKNMSPFEAIEDSTRDESVDVVNDDKWQKFFPICVASPDKSNQFMTRAMFVAFSIVLAKRKVVPEDYFSYNYITENLKVKSLNFHNEKALKITQLIKESGDAVKLGYLDELALVISKNEHDEDALEVFSFKLHYFPGGEVSAQLLAEHLTPMEQLSITPYHNTMAVRDQLMVMSRSIMVLCAKVLKPLPAKFSATFRVKYTENAPADFEIKGFETAKSFYKLHENVQSIGLGQLRPGHHGAFLDCSSIFIEDAEQAVSVIRRYVDRYAKDMGLFADVSGKGSSSSGEATIIPTNTSVSESIASSPELASKQNSTRSSRRSMAAAPYTTVIPRRRS